jgi:hypothetical protein
MNKAKDKTLTAQEAAYVRRLIADHLVYYQDLAKSSKCSQTNRELYELVRGLWEKLA